MITTNTSASSRLSSLTALQPLQPSRKAVEADIRPTCYYPDSSSLEGGFNDRRGVPLKGHTLQEYLRMSPAQQAKGYVAVAMDSTIPYGTDLKIPELEQKMNGGKPINFKVVDTGGAFQGKGTSRMDICVENEKASHNPLLNQTDRTGQGLKPTLHAVFPNGLQAAGSTGGDVLQKGASGPEVKALQQQLTQLGYSTGGTDGVFGAGTEAAVKKFQAAKGLPADGVVGAETRAALDKALRPSLARPGQVRDGFDAAPALQVQQTAPTWTPAPSLDEVRNQGKLLKQGMEGPAVKTLQQLLGVEADGRFGAGTAQAVTDFQKSRGLTPPPGLEGTVGKTTLEALEKSGVGGISAQGQQQMKNLLDVARRNSEGNRPDGRCLWHVGNYLDSLTYGKIGNGNAPRLPEAKDFGKWLNQNYPSMGLKKLALDNPYQAPPGAIVVVRAGTPGTHHPTAGDIAVVGKDGHFYNGGEMGYGGSQNFKPGNDYVIGIFVPA